MEIANPAKVKLIKKVSKFFSIFFKKKSVSEKIDFDKVKEVLVYDPLVIGDTIMTMPLLQILKSNFKNARLTLVCASTAKVILEDSDLVDEFIICKGYKSFESISDIIKDFKHLKDTIKEINKKEYDIAIESRGDFRYLFFMNYINAKRKVSYNYSGGEYFLTDVIEVQENYKETHLVDDKIYLLKQIGCKIDEKDIYPNLKITDEIRKKKEEFVKLNNIENKKIVGIHPGAREAIRRYNKFDEILEKIHNKKNDVVFIIFEGVNEEKEAKKVLARAKECGAKAIHIKTNFREYIKTIPFCDAIICNDSGAAHISNAYKIPTTVMYGPVNPGGIRPYNNKTSVLNCISIPLKCKPCYSQKDCPNNNFECFNSIKVEEVVETIIKNL